MKKTLHLFIATCVVAVISCIMTGCDMDHISGPLYAYSESNSVIPLYAQANEKSPIIKNLPSGTKVQVSWALGEWMFCEVEESKGYVKRDAIRLSSSYEKLPKKNKELDGWHRKMDDHYIVRGKSPVPVLWNRAEQVDEYNVVTYTYDTIDWLEPNTIVRELPWKDVYNPDHRHVDYMFTVNAKDTIKGFVSGYYLKAKNVNIIHRLYQWVYYSNPNKSHKFEQWTDRKLATWKRKCRSVIFDESRSVWNRYRWHFWGVLLWFLLSFVFDRFYLLAFFWNIIIPWVYIHVMPHVFWFGSPWIVGWWCVLGFPAAIFIFYVFWRRFVSHLLRIFVAISNLRIILALFYLCYSIAMGVLCLNLFLQGLYEDIGIIILFFLISMIPSSTSGAGDADRVELIDEFGRRIGGRMEGNRVFGDDGKTYEEI